MTLEYSISAGHPFCMGVMSQTNGIHIAMPFPESEGKECGMLLYKAGHELARIVFRNVIKWERYMCFLSICRWKRIIHISFSVEKSSLRILMPISYAAGKMGQTERGQTAGCICGGYIRLGR